MQSASERDGAVWRSVPAPAPSCAGCPSRVGPKGQVVAVEIDPRFLSDLGQPNVEVRRCDFTRDDVEPGCYDLVHSRLLLMHLSDPAEVLRRMAAALRPGGWLVAEEPDNAVARGG